MAKHLVLFFILFLQCTTQCFAQKTAEAPNYDKNKIAVFAYNETEFPFLQHYSAATMQSSDFVHAEEMLQQFIIEYNAELTRQFNLLTAEQQSRKILLLLDLNKMQRQYIPVMNRAGEKEIWVNCFCNSQGRDWKKELIKSSGERMCNFKIMLNLTQYSYHSFRLLPVKNSL